MDPVLCDLYLDQRHVADLPHHRARRLRVGQITAAAAAGRGDVVENLVGIGDQLHADLGAPGCLPGLRVVGLRRSRAGLPNRSEDSGNDELPKFWPSRRARSTGCYPQVLDPSSLLLEHNSLRLHHRDQFIAGQLCRRHVKTDPWASDET